jgi:hypothetical protein
MVTALRGRFQDNEVRKKNITANWNVVHLDAFGHCFVQVFEGCTNCAALRRDYFQRKYSHAPHNDMSLNRLRIRWWSLKIIVVPLCYNYLQYPV